MQAQPDATETYSSRHPGLATASLGRTGLRVSRAGFGGYRVSSGVEGHRLALRHALTSGINIIDTSANYADGGSEELIGEVVAELVRAGTISRNEIVIVTKAGYIQGSNFEHATERIASGSGFPEVVEYADGLWHCIAPEFLEDQITRSLERLGMQAVDVLLLHNPEYYLGWASHNGVPLDEARKEYYRRIRNAFVYLETEVDRGRIGWYGISSNSFPDPADAADFTSLEEVTKIAEGILLTHHFAVVQFPANLIEREFVTVVNQSSDRTLMQFARDKNLGVLINRPLNAIRNNKLIRLADFPQAGGEISEHEIRQKVQELVFKENEFVTATAQTFGEDEEGRRAINEFLSVGATMQEYWQTFESIERYNELLSQFFAPRLGYVSQYLKDNGTKEHLDWYNGYMNHVRALLHAVGVHYSGSAQKRSSTIKDELARHVGEEHRGDQLAELAIEMLLAIDGVDSVLVGMRRQEYVSSVLNALRHGPVGSEDVWRSLDLSSLFPAASA